MTAHAQSRAAYCAKLSKLYSAIARIHVTHGATLDAQIALTRSLRLAQAADAWKAVS